jgi:hypothetical protein
LVLVVDPDAAPSPAFHEPTVRNDVTTVRLPLGEPAALITAWRRTYEPCAIA